MLLPTQVFPSRGVRLYSALRCHAGLLIVVLFAVALRIGVEIAYRPALLFSDSWRYLSMAYSGLPVGIAPSRPSGYPLLLRLLTFPGRDVFLVTVLQHVAGLLVGVLVYMLLLHLGLPRLVAVAAAAVVMFDSYAMALEQFIMAEAFFTLLVVSAIVLTIVRGASARAVMLAGALLAAACTLRTSALFVIPVWIVYLLCRARDRRRLLSALVGLMLPLLVYASWHAWRTDGSLNFDQAQGWFLYGRIAQIADCSGANVPAPTRPLCYVPAGWRRAFPPGVWIWGAGAPAVSLFRGTPDSHASEPNSVAITARDNGMLEDFAIAIIRAHPVVYASVAASDFVRFFDPSVSPYSDPDGVTVTFPSAPLTAWVWPGPRNRYLPGYVPRLHWPASLITRYQEVFHAPRALLGALSILALVALLTPTLCLARLNVGRRPEILLLAGSGIIMLLGSAALVSFVLRYLIPTIPLLLSGGLLAANELLHARQTRSDARSIGNFFSLPRIHV